MKTLVKSAWFMCAMIVLGFGILGYFVFPAFYVVSIVFGCILPGCSKTR